MAAFAASDAVHKGKVRAPKKKSKTPTVEGIKLDSGNNLYSAVGTREIKSRDGREWDPSVNTAYVDTSDFKEFLSEKDRKALEESFKAVVVELGEEGEDLGGERNDFVPQSVSFFKPDPEIRKETRYQK